MLLQAVSLFPFPLGSCLCQSEEQWHQFLVKLASTFQPRPLEGLQVTTQLGPWQDVCGPGVVPPREGAELTAPNGEACTGHWAGPLCSACVGRALSTAVRSGSRSTPTPTASTETSSVEVWNLGPVPGLWSQHLHLNKTQR